MAPPRGAILSVSLLVLAAVPLVSVPPAAQAAGTVEVFLSGLNVPIALAFSPDGRIFYAERNTGQIRIVANRVILATPFYTLPNTATAGERGLLGLALDPGFRRPRMGMRTRRTTTRRTTRERTMRRRVIPSAAIATAPAQISPTGTSASYLPTRIDSTATASGARARRNG